MRARTLQRPCPHGREQPPSTDTKEVRGLRRRTFSAKRRTQFRDESAAFAPGSNLAVDRVERAALDVSLDAAEVLADQRQDEALDAEDEQDCDTAE
jgi:hypothetical protein